MKSIIRTYAVVVVALILSTSGCKKSSSNTEPVTTKEAQPAETPALTPAGPATRATIGASGGALKSADARMEISVPPGALFADTEISIQPVAATDLDGVGPEYELSPEGSNFAQPVTLAWRLSDDDLAGGPITSVIIATRDENGGWTRQPGVERDPESKTVRVSTTHFSGWKATWLQYLPDVKISPAQAEVRINGSIPLKAEVTRSKPSSEPDDLAAPAPKKADSTAPQPQGGHSDSDLLAAPAPVASKGVSDDDLLVAPSYSWKVNGVKGGNDKWGTVRAGDKAEDVIYKAPAKVPSRNPVTVSCETFGKHARITATSLVTVTDKKGWHVIVHYGYHDEHSESGLTVAGEPATSWGTEDRNADGEFNIYSDPRWAGGAAGGMGTGTLRNEQSGGMKNAMCSTKSTTTISGALQMEGNGNVGGAGTLSVTIHGDDLDGSSSGNGCGGNKFPEHPWHTASFATSCNVVNVDYDKGGTFSGDGPVSDRGHGKCNVTITPQ